MEENKEIKDAEIEEVKKDMSAKPSFAEASAGRRDFLIELALFLILGILIGIAVKTEANKRITIGYNDHKMKFAQQQISINKLEAELMKKLSAEENSEEGETLEGATCGN
ncbi:MAG TPA: hypothetical protein DIT25_02650 [Candidatus Moranbacteria bacterium]|nr:hypothetical protein [Candidatus Moranbacteria bacterium]